MADNEPTIDGRAIGDLKVTELREELQKRGLSKTGLKSALVERLRSFIQDEPVTESSSAEASPTKAHNVDLVEMYRSVQQQMLNNSPTKNGTGEINENVVLSTADTPTQSDSQAEQSAASDSASPATEETPIEKPTEQVVDAVETEQPETSLPEPKPAEIVAEKSEVSEKKEQKLPEEEKQVPEPKEAETTKEVVQDTPPAPAPTPAVVESESKEAPVEQPSEVPVAGSIVREDEPEVERISGAESEEDDPPSTPKVAAATTTPVSAVKQSDVTTEELDFDDDTGVDKSKEVVPATVAKKSTEEPSETDSKPDEVLYVVSGRRSKGEEAKPAAPVEEETPEGLIRVGSLVPAKHEPSNFVRITGLRRPYTVQSLKSILGKFGSLGLFWIDNLRSKVIVSFATVEEATKARDGLSNVKWPVGTDVLLQTEFSTQEEFDAAETPKPVVKPEPVIKVELAYASEAAANVSPAEEAASSTPAGAVDQRLPSKSEDEVVVKKPKKEKVRDYETKAIEDLFRKTATEPFIYYLPLSDEEAAKMEAERLKTQKPATSLIAADEPRRRRSPPLRGASPIPKRRREASPPSAPRRRSPPPRDRDRRRQSPQPARRRRVSTPSPPPRRRRSPSPRRGGGGGRRISPSPSPKRRRSVSSSPPARRRSPSPVRRR